ncbi:MAG TPA: penicillin-binding protein 1B [Crenotrichaceae bacterium]|nr:penicillin-binding protein 1B [Crenotrichaceae bacterium]
MVENNKKKPIRKKPVSRKPAKTTSKKKKSKAVVTRSRTKAVKPRSRKSNRTKPRQSSPLSRRLKRVILGFLVLSGFLFLTYIGYLDYKVQESFAQQQWSLPAKIYARPVHISTRGSVTKNQLIETLKELGYRKTNVLKTPGSYTQGNSELVIKTRAFNFWDGHRPSQRITVRYSGSRIRSVKQTDNGKQLRAFRMEPVVIGRFYPALKEDRVLVSLTEVPQSLIYALLATEDREFYQHHGLSFKAIGRAIIANARSGGIVQGGSTITQQLVKNLYLTPERTWIRKANEAILALLLEYHYSKNEILESYLNEIYLGQDGAREIHGIGLASQFYFGKPLPELELHETALLAGIIKGPSDYNPRKHPARTLKRRNLVLQLMEEQQFITTKQRLAAENKPLDVIAAKRYSSSRYPAFMELIQRELENEFDKQTLTSAGLNIFTTLDLQVQNALETSVNKGIKALEKRRKVEKLQTAAVITHRETGEIVGFAGGRDLRFAGFNRALDAIRPIGSLVKPAVYLSALAKPDQYTLITLLKDQPVKLRDYQGKTWEPENYDHMVHGYVPFHEALTFSYNLATVDLGMELGLGYVAKTLRQMGVNREIRLLPSLLLGALELSPLEVAQMYQTIATQGYLTPLRAIKAVTADDGTLLHQYSLVMRQALEAAPTFLLNTNLQEVMQIGTGKSSAAMVPRSMMTAGKTGTTNGLRDSWFAGYSGDYMSVFWVGRDDNHPIYLTGSSGALHLWSRVMKKIARKPLKLKSTSAIEHVWIDTDNWRRSTSACNHAVQFPFIAGSAPKQLSQCGIPIYEPLDPIKPIKSWFDEFFL